MNFNSFGGMQMTSSNKFPLNQVQTQIGSFVTSGAGFNPQIQDLSSLNTNQLSMQSYGLQNMNFGIQNTNMGLDGMPFQVPQRDTYTDGEPQMLPQDEDFELDNQIDELDKLLGQSSQDQPLEQQKQPKPQKERAIFSEQNQICQINNTKIDFWLDQKGNTQDQQKDAIKNQIKVQQLVFKHLNNLTRKQKIQLQRNLQGGQSSKQFNTSISSQPEQIVEKQEQQNRYVIHKTNNYPKIQILPSQIGTRKYLVYIGSQKFTISAYILTINLMDLKRLMPKSSLPFGKTVKYLLSSENNKYKIKKTYGIHAQHLLQTITQIAMNKASLLIQNNLNKQKLNQNYFGYDFIVFQDCTLFQVIRAQRAKLQKELEYKNEQQEREQQLIYAQSISIKKQVIKNKQETLLKAVNVIQFFKSLKIIFHFKKLLLNSNLTKIQQQLKTYEKTEFLNILISITKTYVTYLQSINKQSQEAFNITNLIKTYSQSKNNQVSEMILKAVNFTDQFTKVTQLIETLNKFGIVNEKKCLEINMKMLTNISAKCGFIDRYARAVFINGKYKQSNQTVFMRIRKAMLYFVNQIKDITAVQLQKLYEYFSGIGDQPNCRVIQKKLLQLSQPTINYVLTLFKFFLEKKISTTSFDSYLHNKYIKILQQYKIEEIKAISNNKQKIEVLQKFKKICISIMMEIRSCVYRRQYQILKTSNLQKQYINLGSSLKQTLGKQWDQIGYNDISLYLDHIYNKNCLKLDREAASQLSCKILRGQQSSSNQKPISCPYLRLTLLKNYFFMNVYLSKTKQLSQMKRIILVIPPLYRYYSIFFCGLTEISTLYENTQAILKSNYLQLLNQSDNNYSTDLLILIQLMLKFQSQIYEHDKFKLQINMRSLQQFLNNLDEFYQPANQQQTICLLRNVSELFYSIARDNIMDLQKMRQRLCTILLKRFQLFLTNNKIENFKDVPIKDEKKQEYLHANSLALILKLSNEQKMRKKQSIPILKQLLARYPQKFTIYYYFLKIKYGIRLTQKKLIRDIIFDNLIRIVKQKNQKAFGAFVVSQMFLNQLLQVLYGELKQKALDFITDMAAYAIQLGDKIKTKLLNQHIFKFYQHFLNQNQTPEEQSYCCYRKMTQILLGRLQINFDASELPNRVLNLSVIRKNFYLAYPVFQTMNFKKVSLPDYKKDSYTLQLLNKGLGLFSHTSQVLNKCRVKIYQFTKEYYINMQLHDSKQIDRFQRKIRLLYKKQYFLSQQHDNWINQTIETLQKRESQQVQIFKAALQIQKKERGAKEKADYAKFKQQKNEKYIRRIFKKIKTKLEKISVNCFVENEKPKENK